MTGYLVSGLIAALTLLSWCPAFALEPTLMEDIDFSWRSVQGGADSNPMVSFNGDLTGGHSTIERFTDVPAWIVSEDFDGDGVYEAAVQFTDGTLRILSLKNGNLRTVASVRKMAPGVAPVVMDTLDGELTGGIIGIDDSGDLVSIEHSTGRARRLASGFSTLSYPMAADLDGDGDKEIAAVSDEGYMTIVKSRTQTRTENKVKLLPDTRITAADMDGDGILEIVALSKPTDELSSGRLGDDLDAQGITVFNWNGRTLRVVADLELNGDQVFEMLTPVIAGDGSADDLVLMLTVTEKSKGTGIRSYSFSKGRVREKRKGPVSDQEQWIHILGSSALGDGVKVFLITALISKDDEDDLELYSLDLTRTRITLRSAAGTHRAGSRLLEAALIGDFDRDGALELLAPGDGKSSLAVFNLERNRLNAREIFNSAGSLGTNLCPGDFNGDGIGDIMFGLDDGTLVILFGE